MNIFLHPPKHSPLCPRCRPSEESSRKKETWIVSCQGRGCMAERSAAKSQHPFPCPCFVLTSSCILHSVSGESLTTYPHPLQKAPPQMLVSPKQGLRLKSGWQSKQRSLIHPKLTLKGNACQPASNEVPGCQGQPALETECFLIQDKTGIESPAGSDSEQTADAEVRLPLSMLEILRICSMDIKF